MASVDSGVETSNDSSEWGPIVIFKSPFELDRQSLSNFPTQLPTDGFPSELATSPQHSGNPYKMRVRLRLREKRINCRYKNTTRDEMKLRVAVTTNNLELLTRLLRDGINPNASDGHKRSPLHLAASRGYEAIVAQLLAYGANPNITDSLGNTPLHLAVCTNNFVVVNRLMKAGANLMSIDRNGKNPIELAKSKLRIIQNNARIISGSPKEATHILTEMRFIVTMMITFMCKQERDSCDLEALETRLQNMTTKEVECEVGNLLDNLEGLSLGG